MEGVNVKAGVLLLTLRLFISEYKVGLIFCSADALLFDVAYA